MSKCIAVPSDGELVGACLRGDSEGGQLLFARHYGPISGYIRKCLQRSGCTEPVDHGQNLTQGTLTNVFSNLGGLEDPNRFVPYLVRAATRACFAHLETCRTEKVNRVSLDDVLNLAPAQAISIHQVIESTQRAKKWLSLADGISPTFGQIIRYYEVDEFNFHEIAVILNMSFAKVRNIYYRNLPRWKDEARRQEMR